MRSAASILRSIIKGIADHPVYRVADLLTWRFADIRARLDRRLVA